MAFVKGPVYGYLLSCKRVLMIPYPGTLYPVNGCLWSWYRVPQGCHLFVFNGFL